MKSRDITLPIGRKAAFLAENWTPTEPTNRKRECSHCGLVFEVLEYKATVDADGFKAIRCPSWPACDGTVIDWVEPGSMGGRLSK